MNIILIFISLGPNHFFPNFFSKPIFPNFLEKFGKLLWKKFGKKFGKPERTPKEHVSSETISPTLSELCFRADVRRHDRVAVYDDDNIKKKLS
jgi:hypothetical protein